VRQGGPEVVEGGEGRGWGSTRRFSVRVGLGETTRRSGAGESLALCPAPLPSPLPPPLPAPPPRPLPTPPLAVGLQVVRLEGQPRRQRHGWTVTWRATRRRCAAGQRFRPSSHARRSLRRSVARRWLGSYDRLDRVQARAARPLATSSRRPPPPTPRLWCCECRSAGGTSTAAAARAAACSGSPPASGTSVTSSTLAPPAGEGGGDMSRTRPDDTRRAPRRLPDRRSLRRRQRRLPRGEACRGAGALSAGDCRPPHLRVGDRGGGRVARRLALARVGAAARAARPGGRRAAAAAAPSPVGDVAGTRLSALSPPPPLCPPPLRPPPRPPGLGSRGW